MTEPSAFASISQSNFSQLCCKICNLICCSDFAASKRFISSNQKAHHCCRYSTGRYSLCGLKKSQPISASVPLNSGVPPPLQNPTITPALASSRIAACVMEVPLPNNRQVVFAIGIFQYKDSLPWSVTYSTRPPLSKTRQCSK